MFLFQFKAYLHKLLGLSKGCAIGFGLTYWQLLKIFGFIKNKEGEYTKESFF